VDSTQEKAGDSTADQKKTNPANDKSTASGNSPNDVKPGEIGVKPETTKTSTQPEEPKPDVATVTEDLAKLAVKPKCKYPDAMPKVNITMKYKPMKHITQADHFLYHVPKVYCDALNFNWRERDF